MLRARSEARTSLTASTSGAASPVVSVRTPHEISKPTPPAETTPPCSAAKAATPPIGNPIAPVRVRHDVDGLHDAGKRCDIDRLLADLLVHVTGELLGCVNNDRHPHVGGRGEPPRALRDPLERAQVHDEPICLNVDDALRDPLIAFLADS